MLSFRSVNQRFRLPVAVPVEQQHVSVARDERPHRRVPVVHQANGGLPARIGIRSQGNFPHFREELKACRDQARSVRRHTRVGEPGAVRDGDTGDRSSLDVEDAEVVRCLLPCDREVRHQQVPVIRLSREPFARSLHSGRDGTEYRDA